MITSKRQDNVDAFAPTRQRLALMGLSAYAREFEARGATYDCWPDIANDGVFATCAASQRTRLLGLSQRCRDNAVQTCLMIVSMAFFCKGVFFHLVDHELPCPMSHLAERANAFEVKAV